MIPEPSTGTLSPSSNHHQDVHQTIPFGRVFKLTSRQCARVFFGSQANWAKCKREASRGWRDNLLLPSGEDPRQFLWPVNGRDVLIFDHHEVNLKYIKLTCLALLEAGAKRILVLRDTGTFLVEQH